MKKQMKWYVTYPLRIITFPIYLLAMYINFMIWVIDKMYDIWDVE